MSASTAPLEVSVIIPVRNGMDSLPALLESLQRQTLDPGRYEVIVVDNGSSDATAEVAASYGARVVHEPMANRSRARNRGAAQASTPLYAFTDADCVAHPQWLDELVGCAPLAPLVAGDVKLRTSETPNAIERFEALWRFGQRSWVQQGWASTANLLVHAQAFDSIGGFDAAYRHYGEDADFCIRASKAGFGLAYCSQASVEHAGESRLLPFLRRFFMHGYGGTQTSHRLGAGYRAWRHPLPVLAGARALSQFGYSPESFSRHEWRRMARLAQLGYAARIGGSLWAEAVRAR